MNGIECRVKGCDVISDSWDQHKQHILEAHPVKPIGADQLGNVAYVFPQLKDD